MLTRNRFSSLKKLASRSILVIVSLISIIFGGATAKVFAANNNNGLCADNVAQADCASLYGNWTDWNPNGGNTCGTNGGPSTLSGADNVQKIYNYFVSHGLSAAGAAGILGNMSRESGWDATAEQSPGAWEDMSSLYFPDSKGGVGLVQWDGGRRPAAIRYLQSKGLTDADLHKPSDTLLSNELDYIMKELTESYPTTLAMLKTITDPQLAAFGFHAEYEGSSDNPTQIQDRLDAAQKIYEKYSGATPGGTGTGSTPTACSGNNSAYILDSSGFVYYAQCDPRWADTPFSDSNICGSGCSITSLAMIISTLTGQSVLPSATAAYATQIGDAVKIPAKIAPDLAAHWNLKATNVGTDVNKINAALQAGGLVITGGKGPLPFTTPDGHYFVIKAVTADGKWILADPAALNGKTPTYDPQTVIAAGMVADATFAITK